METNKTIAAAVKEYILREFLPDEDSDELQDGTPLMTSGILDSIATLKLVSFLEQRFDIAIAAHEANVEHLNTIREVSTLVQAKLGKMR